MLFIDHVRNAKKGRKGHKYSIIRSMLKTNVEMPIVVIRHNLTLIEAKELETILVKVIGKYPNGPSVKLTDGGDSPPEVSFWQGKVRSQETIDKIKKSLTGKKLGPYSKERIAKMAIGLRGRKVPSLTEEHKAKLAESTQLSWTNPTVRESRTGMKNKNHSEETRQKMRTAALFRMNEDELFIKSIVRVK